MVVFGFFVKITVKMDIFYELGKLYMTARGLTGYAVEESLLCVVVLAPQNFMSLQASNLAPEPLLQILFYTHLKNELIALKKV